MTTEERESKSAQWRTDNLGKNVGLANVVQRIFLFTGIYEGEKFEIKVTEQDRESAIAYFEINYPWHTWRQTEEVS
jgi:purine-nucleoside phosphorylase